MLGKKNKSNPNEKKIFLKIRSKDKAGVKIVPYVFEIQDKVGDDYVPRVETTDAVSGDLDYVHLDTYEHEGEDKNTVKLYLKDGDEVYITDLRYNNLTRGLYNSLLNLTTFENLSISLYSAVDKTTKVTWPAISLWQGETWVKWKYQPSELPEIAEHKIGNKVIKDSSELDAFLLQKLTEFAARVKATRSGSVTTPAVGEPASAENPAPAPTAEAPVSSKPVRVGKKTVKVTVPVEPTSDSDENVDTDSIPF